MRRALTLALPMMMLLGSLPVLAPTASGAAAGVVGTLDLGLAPDGSELGIVGSSAATYGGKSYVFGGRLSTGTYSDKIYEYDHATRQVREVGALPTGRQSGTAVTLQDRIYYFGGAELIQFDINGDGQAESVPRSSNDIVQFNPATGQTRTLTVTLPEGGAWGMSSATSVTSDAACRNGCAFLFGGFTFDVNNLASITRRDWIIQFNGEEVSKLSSRLPFKVQDAGATRLTNRIYLFGGLSDNDNATNPCPTTRYYDEDAGDYRETRQSVCATDRITVFEPGSRIATLFTSSGAPVTLDQRMQFVSAAAVGGTVYIPGGRLPDGTASSTIYEFAPAASPHLRALVPTLPRGLFGAPSTVDDAANKILLFGGRYGEQSELTDDVVAITAGATPAFPPRGLATTPLAAGGLRLTWEPPAYDGDAPIIGYKVYRGELGHNVTLLARVNGLSHDDTTARPGTQYVYRVSALNMIGGVEHESEPASTSRETEVTVPGVVRNLQAYPGNAHVLVQWSPPAETGGAQLSGYRIFRNDTLLRSVPAAELQFRDSDVVNGVAYRYTVRAVNAKGDGAAAPARTVVPAAVPDAPASVAATPDAGGVRVSWIPPTTPADRFLVYRGTLPGATTRVAELLSGTTEFMDTSVERGNTYYYVVRSANSVGESPPSTLARASLVTKPGAPENVFASPLEAAVRVTWQPPADLGEANAADIRYYVSRQDPGSDTFRILDTGGDLASTFYVDTRVVPNREYVYTVTTLNPLESDPSAPVAAKPREVQNQRPLAVIAPDVTAAEPFEQVTFDASGSSDPDGRVVYYLFEWGDGTSLVNTTEPRATYAWRSEGFYVVNLTVVDERGEASDPQPVVIKVGDPATRVDGPGGGSGNGGGGPTATPAPPGSKSGRIPGPGAALALVAAALGAALVAAGRRG